MKIQSRDGLLWHKVGPKWEVMDLPFADAIAHANGFAWAENVVKKFDGKDFHIDPETRKIQTIEEDFV